MRADILELFASFSEPDDFTQQYQLELFAWARKQRAERTEWTRYLERKRDKRRASRDQAAATRRWRENNKDKQAACQAAYRAANREKRNAYFRARRAAQRAARAA